MHETKTRESNFELLRIIAMLMVVTLHYTSHGGAMYNVKPYGLNCAYIYFLRSFSIIAVNCYVLITGYFMVNSKFNKKRVFKLMAETALYSTAITIILISLNEVDINASVILKSIFPVFLRQYWFIACYMALLFMAPYINILLKALNKQQFTRLVIVLISIFSLWNSLIPKETLGISNFTSITSGYSVNQLVLVYILGAYIRLHWQKNINKYTYLAIYLGIAMVSGIISVYLISIGNDDLVDKLTSYEHIMIIVQSVCFFMFFKGIKLKSIFINKIASSTFAVYLLHDHFLVRDVIYKEVLKTQKVYNTILLIPHSIVSILFVFTICICIDMFIKNMARMLSQIIKHRRNQPIEHHQMPLKKIS